MKKEGKETREKNENIKLRTDRLRKQNKKVKKRRAYYKTVITSRNKKMKKIK